MIRIKKPITLIESDIPVPIKIIEYFIKQVKIHVLRFLMSTIKFYILELENDVKKEDDNSIIEKINYSIKRYQSFLKILDQEYPSGILKKDVEELTNLEDEIFVKDFLDSDYKYKLLNDRSNLNFKVYFQYDSPQHNIAEYRPDLQLIIVFVGVWKKFTDNPIYWFLKILNTKDLKEKLNKLWGDYRSAFHHELTHWVQNIFIPQGNWEKNSFMKYINSEEDYKKYITSNLEFFPKLKGEYENFWSKFNQFNNDLFKKYINDSTFFQHLQKLDSEKYQKAVKQFYMLLQNKRS